MQQIHVVSLDNSVIVQPLIAELTNNSITNVDTAELKLTILQTEFTTQPIAYDAIGRTSRAMVQLQLGYQVQYKNRKLADTINLQREFAFSNQAILSTDRIKDLSQSEMLDEAIEQIFAKLESFACS